MAVDIIARGMAGDAGEQAEIAQRFVVSPYDPTQTYNPNDIVSYDGKLYLCTGTNVTGTFDPSKWSQIVISSELTEIINKLATITNPMLIKGRVDTVDELPADAEPGWVYFVGTDEETNLDEYVYTEDEEWQYIGTAHVEVDDALSTTSTNPVQNKVVTNALNEKYPIAWDVTVTQAQYDALPESKNYDGKHYHISDGGVAPQNIIVYGWHVNPNESDPEAAITYLKDAVGMEPASMGASTFDYGTWGNAFFMPKPCMLKSDGTVDYYLDPNDYTKKADGTASDVANTAYDGNAMMEWPVIWWKYEAGTGSGEGYFYCSNRKVDDSYHCWCNYDANDNISGHFYTAIYDSIIDSNDKMRSISGVRITSATSSLPSYSKYSTYAVGDVVRSGGTPTAYICTTPITTPESFNAEHWEVFTPNRAGGTTGAEEINAALENNTTADVEWYANVWSDWLLIYGLLVLMSKSLDVINSYGKGYTWLTDMQAQQAYVTGALNTAGLFYGDTSTNTSPVKVFGMENWWGLRTQRYYSLFITYANYLYKLTWGTADGSGVVGYNTTADGYLNGSEPVRTNGYIQTCSYGEYGLLPSAVASGSSSSSTYYCTNYYVIEGGSLTPGTKRPMSVGSSVSATMLIDFYSASSTRATTSVRLSCKPLAQSN